MKAIHTHLSPSASDRRALAQRAEEIPGPEILHPDAREAQMIWRRGEVIIWLFNSSGRRFMSIRAGSPEYGRVMAQMQALSAEAAS